MTNPANFDWNDLRILLTVARTGSTIAAGKALGLSQSTVHRRVTALEQALNAKRHAGTIRKSCVHGGKQVFVKR